MAKYNLTEKKDKKPDYINTLSVQLVDSLYEQILLKLVVDKKYRDPKYSATIMAEEIGSNPRYLSAVVGLRYHDNFSQLINDFRIKEAQYMLTDKHFRKHTIEEIANAVGFANRQSFYAAFYRRHKITPADYREKFSKS